MARDGLGARQLLESGSAGHVGRIRGDDVHGFEAYLGLVKFAQVGEYRLEGVLQVVGFHGFLQQLDGFLLDIHRVDEVGLHILAEYQGDYSAAGTEVANHAVRLYVGVVRQQECVRAEAVVVGHIHRQRSEGEGFGFHFKSVPFRIMRNS